MGRVKPLQGVFQTGCLRGWRGEICVGRVLRPCLLNDCEAVRVAILDKDCLTGPCRGVDLSVVGAD